MAKSDQIDIEKIKAYIQDHRSANQIARLMGTCSQVIKQAVSVRAPEFGEQLMRNGLKRHGGVKTTSLG